MTDAPSFGTLGSALREAAAVLRRAGAATPELDARVLAAHVLEADAAGLIAASRSPLSRSRAERLGALIQRRAAGEPVARILGRREFWGLNFELNAATLVPRPDSETVVAAALELIDRGVGRTAPLHLADLGTGSGCLLVALLTELPEATGVGIDVSAEALRVARANAVRHGVGSRAVFAVGHWAEALRPGVDVIVANPPYIPGDAISLLGREVARFDPRAALDGGADGLAAYRALFPSARRALRGDGIVLVEIGEGQAEAVRGLMQAACLVPCESWCDLAGRTRVLSARPLPSEAGRRQRTTDGESASQKPLGMDLRTG